MSGLSEQEREAVLHAWPWPQEAATTRDGFSNVVGAVEAIVAARVGAARGEAAAKVEAWAKRWEARAGDYRAPVDSIMRAHASRLHDLAADIRKGDDDVDA